MTAVIKRNGIKMPFDGERIRNVVAAAFEATLGTEFKNSSRLQDVANRIVEGVQKAAANRPTIGVEEIQDLVEKGLMALDQHETCRAYILYREERARSRKLTPFQELGYTDANGLPGTLTVASLESYLADACQSLANVSANAIASEAIKNLFDGAAWSDVHTALVMTARTMIEREPDYSFVAARLLAAELTVESRRTIGIAESSSYADDLVAALDFGVKIERIDPRLTDGRFNIEFLGNLLRPEGDLQFTYLAFQTLYDRYFLHHEENRFERAQVFFMRVAMGLALDEKEATSRAAEFYELLSSFNYLTSTPTLFNAGTLRPQLSSCYLTTVPDDLSGIYHAIHDNAMLSKFAGGLGNDWTPVRALGSYIKGTNGKSQGVVPFLKVVNDTAVAVNQGGKRKGAVCAYLETWHMDIEEFIELRKNTGDDRRRTHDMNTANWIPDLFMKRVFDNGDWTLFSPSDVPDLHDLVGTKFERRYEAYERQAEIDREAKDGKLKHSRKIKAGDLWRKMLSMLFETGHPWLTFKDPCNIRSPQQHVGVVHSSNLCTEITLNTQNDEIAVCNLGSINLPNHIVNGKLDMKKLKATIDTAVRMLDNVIDINFYAVEAARNANMRHRPVGLGIMGFQDALYELKMPYASDAAVQFADESMEAISYFAILASCDLAEERGAYQSFPGSKWSLGILPIDSIAMLREERGAGYLDQDETTTLDWAPVREKVKKGVRNSNIMAIAPTATISNITGVTQSIEPTYQNLYVKSNLSGEFTVINPYLVRDLKALGLWDATMINDLKYYDGSLAQIERIPQDLKALYATAFEVEARWLIDAASRRQKWIDQAQSLNLYIAGASGKKLDVTYRMAWYRGLKTTYYLRALAATSTEKSTVNTGKLNAVSK
jgi:ribonucleoside-diphosphate reductase alpha chain